MRFKAFLFDMNGVLVDDEHLQEEASRRALLPLGFNLTTEEYLKYFIGKTDGKGFKDYLAEKKSVQNIDSIIEQKGQYYKLLAHTGLRSYKGVDEFVKSLAETKLSMAVVTSSVRSEASVALDALNLSNYFKVTVTAEDIESSKPEPEGYIKAAFKLSVEPSECVVIEDAPSGIKAAKSAGMFCVAVLNTHTKEELLDADIIVKRLSPATLGKLRTL